MPDSAVEKRLASLQAWIVAGLLFMFVAACGFVAVACVVVVVTGGRVEAAKKKSDRGLACYVLPQLDRAEKTLPTLAYYVNHPQELAKQLAVIYDQRQLAVETWGNCDSLSAAP